MQHRLTSWLSRTFGATPTDDTARLVVVFEGSPGECELVAIRLKSERLLVFPDPTPPPALAGGGRANAFRTSGRNEFGLPSSEVAVRIEDEDRARAILATIRPI